MSYFYVRLMLIPVFLFTAALLLIHAQLYDDHELREFLLMRGCSTPCFMRITPGVTLHEEVVKLLKENPWVEKITYEDNTSIKWAWSGQQPIWINPTKEGSLSLYADKVTGIQFPSVILLGEVLFTQTGLYRFEQFFYQRRVSVTYTLEYPESDLLFAFVIGCNYHAPYLQPVYVNVVNRLRLYDNTDILKQELPKPFRRCP